MKKHLIHLAIASGAALLAFVLLGLLTAYFSSVAGNPPILKLLPEVDEAQALIRRTITPEIQSELPLVVSKGVIDVAGHLICDKGENVRVEVDITQAASQAHATGSSLEPCTGELQIWDAVAVARGHSPRFDPGAAWACAVATTRKGNQITDTFRWCKQVSLVEK